MAEQLEEMFFFKGGCVDLLGFLHRPAHSTRTTAIVHCHPFAEEKNCSHAVTVKAARAFARQGFVVFRFDYSGCGDSGGEFSDFSLQDWIEDTNAAIAELKRRTRSQNVILWGTRLGAALALACARDRDDVAGLILWQPSFHFKDYIHQFIRQKLVSDFSNKRQAVSLQALLHKVASGGAVQVYGYPISTLLYASFLAMDDAYPHPETPHPSYIATISNMPSAPLQLVRDSEWLMQNPASSCVHIVEEPFWDRYWRWDAVRTIEKTQAWLTKIQGG